MLVKFSHGCAPIAAPLCPDAKPSYEAVGKSIYILGALNKAVATDKAHFRHTHIHTHTHAHTHSHTHTHPLTLTHAHSRTRTHTHTHTYAHTHTHTHTYAHSHTHSHMHSHSHSHTQTSRSEHSFQRVCLAYRIDPADARGSRGYEPPDEPCADLCGAAQICQL